MASGHLHESVEDGEFHLQLDAVDECLVRRLDGVLAGVLEGEDHNVKDDDDDVDDDEVVPQPPRSTLRPHDGEHAAELCGFDDVDGRDDDFLEEEYRDLYLLIHPIRPNPFLRVCRARPKQKDDGGSMHRHSIHNNHPQHQLQLERIPQDKMQPRPQHHGLPRDHAHPAHCDDARVREAVGLALRPDILEQEAGAVDEDAVGGDDKGPEVDARVAVEDAPDDKGELDDVVDGDAGEDDDDEGGRAVANWAFAYAEVSCHLRSVESYYSFEKSPRVRLRRMGEDGCR